MTAPGYGGNDLALIVKIAWKLKEIYKRSPGQFQALQRAALGLEIAVKQAVKSSPSDQLSEAHQVQLAFFISQARKLLEKLHNRLKTYESLATNDYSTWDRFKFGGEDIRSLQEELNVLSTALHSFRTDVIGTKVTEIKDLLNELVKDKAQTGDIISTSSVIVAQDLTDGLAERGIPQDFIANNGPLIINWIVDLVKKQGFDLEAETDIDPLSPIAPDEKPPVDVAEIEGDDQTIVDKWLDIPDQPRNYVGTFFVSGRSPSMNSTEWEVPSLVRTNSSQLTSGEPEPRKSSFLYRFVNEVGSSSTAHGEDPGHVSSIRSRESSDFSSPSIYNTRKPSRRRQESGSSLGVFHLEDVSGEPNRLEDSTQSPSKAVSVSSASGSDLERLPSSSPSTYSSDMARLSRYSTSPTTIKSSPRAVDATPRSTPSHRDSMAAIGLGINHGQKPDRQPSKTQSIASSLPSTSQKRSSRSIKRRNSSSPKSKTSGLFSRLGDSHQAEAW